MGSGQHFGDEQFLGLDTPTWILWGVLLAVVVTLLVLIARARWLGIRQQMFRKTPAAEALCRPGILDTHLNAELWERVFKATLARATQTIGRQDGDVAREAAAALARLRPVEGALATPAHQTALKAARTGTLQSCLARTPEQLVYVLVFPARHEHSGLFRRHEGFADGWVEHVAGFRRQLEEADRSAPLLCLLYFLGSQAADGTLVVAYEGEAGRLMPADLVPAADGEDGPALRMAGGFDFQLA
jgi:hypothetical protein